MVLVLHYKIVCVLGASRLLESLMMILVLFLQNLSNNAGVTSKRKTEKRLITNNTKETDKRSLF